MTENMDIVDREKKGYAVIGVYNDNTRPNIEIIYTGKQDDCIKVFDMLVQRTNTPQEQTDVTDVLEEMGVNTDLIDKLEPYGVIQYDFIYGGGTIL